MAMTDVNATLPMQGGGKYNILRGNDEVAINQEVAVNASASIGKYARKVYVTCGDVADRMYTIPAAASMPHQIMEFTIMAVVAGGFKFEINSVDAQDVTTGRDLDAAGDWIRIQSVDGLWVVLAYNQA